jgi:hypothetical protein
VVSRRSRRRRQPIATRLSGSPDAEIPECGLEISLARLGRVERQPHIDPPWKRRSPLRDTFPGWLWQSLDTSSSALNALPIERLVAALHHDEFEIRTCASGQAPPSMPARQIAASTGSTPITVHRSARPRSPARVVFPAAGRPATTISTNRVWHDAFALIPVMTRHPGLPAPIQRQTTTPAYRSSSSVSLGKSTP